MMKTFMLCHCFVSIVFGFAVFPLEQQQVFAKPIWQPAVGAKFQIILDSQFGRNRNAELMPVDADIFDVDLFDITADVIKKTAQARKESHLLHERWKFRIMAARLCLDQGCGQGRCDEGVASRAMAGHSKSGHFRGKFCHDFEALQLIWRE